MNSTDYLRYKKGSSRNYNYHVGVGVPYGNLPEDMLVAKYEHSGDIKGHNYYDYGRELLKDRRPDAPAFEYEKTRRGYDSAGFLNLMHSGGRGTENFPAHPELNLEQTDIEPRRIYTDPDFNKMNDQTWARVRYKKMYPGNNGDSIPGGNFHPTQLNNMRNYFVDMVKPRMRIFSTSYDGRHQRQTYIPYTGLSALINALKTEESHGEIMKTAALTPQRKTTALSNLERHNSKWYNLSTSDHRFSVAQYGHNINKIKLCNAAKRGQLTTDIEFLKGRCVNPKMAKIMDGILNQLKIVEAQHKRHGAADCTSKLRAAQLKIHDFERALYETINEARFNKTMGAANNKGAALIVKNSDMTETEKIMLEERKQTIRDAINIYGQLIAAGDYISIKHEAVDDFRANTKHGEAKNTTAHLSKFTGGIPDTIITVKGKNITPQHYKGLSSIVADKIYLNTEDFGARSKEQNAAKTPGQKELMCGKKNTDQDRDFGHNGQINHFSGRGDPAPEKRSANIRTKIDKDNSMNPSISQ